MSLRGKRGNLCHHTSHPWHRPQQVEWPRWHRWSRCSHSHRLSRWQPHPWSRIPLGTVSCWMLNTKREGYKCLHSISVRDRKVKNVFTHFLFNSLSLDHRTVGIIFRSWHDSHPTSCSRYISQHHHYLMCHPLILCEFSVCACVHFFVYVCVCTRVCTYVHVHACTVYVCLCHELQELFSMCLFILHVATVLCVLKM